MKRIFLSLIALSSFSINAGQPLREVIVLAAVAAQALHHNPHNRQHDEGQKREIHAQQRQAYNQSRKVCKHTNNHKKPKNWRCQQPRRKN